MGSSVSLNTRLLERLLWLPYGASGRKNAMVFEEVDWQFNTFLLLSWNLAAWLHLAQAGLEMSVACVQEVEGR